MGTDISVVLQKRGEDGQWMDIDVPEFFADPNYALFGWLVGVRNHSAVTPLSTPRGLPADFHDAGRCGEHDVSWLWLNELLSVDFDQIIEDRRYSDVDPQTGLRWSALTAPPGAGQKTPLRDFLGPSVLNDLARAEALGVERIVFGFDS